MQIGRSVAFAMLMALGAALLVLAGCPRGAEQMPEMPMDMPMMDDPGAPPVGTTTTIQSKGSDTLLQVAQALAEAYKDVKPEVEVSVTGGGSGTGMQALIEGTAEIANSSRPIKASERETAADRGVQPVETIIGYDGIAVIVHKDSPVDQLTLDQLSDIYTGEITNWNAVGGSGEVALFSRDTASGTYEVFKEQVVQKGGADKGRDYSPTAILLPSTTAIRMEVAKNTAAIGYIGLGYVDDGVKVIAIVGADGVPVMPDAETILSGAYPVARPLYLYVDADARPEVREFMDWVLSDQGQAIVVEQGFVPVK